MNPDPSKSWSVFFRPVKKNQCFDVDIGSILEDFKRDYEEKAKVNFTEAALVIQGAVHTVGLKIDAIHQEALDLVEFLASGGAENGEENEGAGGEAVARRRRRFNEADAESEFIKKFLEDDDYMGEDLLENDESITLKDDEFDHEDNLKEEDYLPERDHFFGDLVGSARGKEITDIDTGAYICQRNDVWIYRAPFTDNGYVYPQSRDQQKRFGERHQEPGAHEYNAFLDESLRDQRQGANDGDANFDQQSFQNFEPDFDAGGDFEPQEIVSKQGSEAEEAKVVESRPPENLTIAPEATLNSSLAPERSTARLSNDQRKYKWNWFEEKPDFAKRYAEFMGSKVSHRMYGYDEEMKLSFNTERWKFDNQIDKRPLKKYEFNWPMMKPEKYVKVIDSWKMKLEAKKVETLRQQSDAKIAKQKKEFNKTMREYCVIKPLPKGRKTKNERRTTEHVQQLITNNFAAGTDVAEIEAEVEQFAPQEIVHESTGIQPPEQFEEAPPCFPEPVDDRDSDETQLEQPHLQTTAANGDVYIGDLNMTRLKEVALGGGGVLRGHLPDTEIEANVLQWKRAIAPNKGSDPSSMLSTSCVESSDVVTCKDLYRGVPHWERSRKFAAMLQMANEGKLEIIPPPEDSDPIDNFSVRPITENRIHCAGDDVDPYAVSQKRFRALSSPKSSDSPAPKRKSLHKRK
ncbi:Oidioi.mRNA.OKI2018_I69.XSR.g16326.t1.cds [Oikopleura dioica]|uniref:Condensin-2 complex subunit H2 n=1 Tax=Oikopleura dioica TaxID=34765 RepID=A0ABN7SJZ1_OIKDI|nr:Oidioi.mRNA.OKI2018_I69.XSR.g16326.t1.cds [Oikopleura dioica]